MLEEARFQFRFQRLESKAMKVSVAGLGNVDDLRQNRNFSPFGRGQKNLNRVPLLANRLGSNDPGSSFGDGF